MRQLTLAEIEAIVSSGDFDDFIDVRENDVLEVKPSVKPVSSAGFDLFLGKYIASFANQKGGYLILGLECADRDDSKIPHDVVKKLNLIQKAGFYSDEEIKQIRGRLANVIYPKVETEIFWAPYKKNPVLGLGVVYVGPQSEDSKYFFVAGRELSEEKLQKELYGVPIRKDDDTDWLSVAEIHRISKSRPNNLQEVHARLSEQLDRILDKLDSSPESSVAMPAISDELKARVNKLLGL